MVTEMAGPAARTSRLPANPEDNIEKKQLMTKSELKDEYSLMNLKLNII